MWKLSRLSLFIATLSISSLAAGGMAMTSRPGIRDVFVGGVELRSLGAARNFAEAYDYDFAASDSLEKLRVWAAPRSITVTNADLPVLTPILGKKPAGCEAGCVAYFLVDQPATRARSSGYVRYYLIARDDKVVLVENAHSSVVP